jgi:hypothetical protein
MSLKPREASTTSHARNAPFGQIKPFWHCGRGGFICAPTVASADAAATAAVLKIKPFIVYFPVVTVPFSCAAPVLRRRKPSVGSGPRPGEA